MPSIVLKTIAITGGSGNLSQKLMHHLLTWSGVTRLIGLDVRHPDPEHVAALHKAAQPRVVHIDMVQCDLSNPTDQRWQEAIDHADAVVHFAAQNPYPEATWNDSAASLDMTLHAALAAVKSPRCRRFVFATSNHVMGRYKDDPLAGQLQPGELHTGLEAGVGTVWDTGQTIMDSTAYAVAKFAGERVCRALAYQSGGKTTFVCVRIGWCQPGENRPDTLSASGSPTLQSSTSQLDPEILARTEAWFKEMWLSNRDFVHLFEQALTADASDWPAPWIVVNGMSANTGMKWSIEATKKWLGYQPLDDVYSGTG